MDYFALLNNICDKVDYVEEKEKCCDEPDVQIKDFVNVCVNCGIVQDNMIEEVDAYNPNCIKENIFYPKSSATIIGKTNNPKFKSLSRISKWTSHSSKDTEANKCYKLIEEMLLKIISNFKKDNCLGEKVLFKAKLYWKAFYYNFRKNKEENPTKPKSTRGEPRKCLFGFCILKGLEFYDFEFKVIQTLKDLGVNIKKYNDVLKTKVEDDDKIFVNKQINKYLEIINNHNPFITLEVLTERYNINMKNKIRCSILPKREQINVNPSSLLKAISYDYIRDSITKQDACEADLLNISSLTLNKALKIII